MSAMWTTSKRRPGRAILVAVALAVVSLSGGHGSANAPAPAPAAEKPLERADPKLYAAARQYFPGDEAGIPKKRIFRLTRDQIDATVAVLLPGYDLPSVKEAMPRDSLQTNYEYAELLSLNGANIGALSGWIGQIAAKVRAEPKGVIDCPAVGAEDACRRGRARDFVLKAFRGDVSEDRIGKIAAFYLDAVKVSGAAQAAGDLVEVVLNSPSFLYRGEIDVNASARLTPAQLLQAVSYTLADAPPEALGLSSAQAAQYLRNGGEAGETIRAIVASKPARSKLQRFFTAWLELKEPGDFTISPQVFPEFTPAMAAAMHGETQRFLGAQLGKERPRLTDITQATQAVVSKPVAALYGARTVAPPSGSGWVDVDAGQRLGIFSQPAVVASHSGPTNSRPIKRGVFWVRKVMCMQMKPPPPGLHVKLYEKAGTTEREKIESVTKAANCAGCHKVIDPLAFFQESYDALGRWRDTDNGAPVDASVLIDFLDEEPIKTPGTVAALKTLTDSLMFKQCFVRQLFRFYMGRQEEAGDEPMLRRIFFEFAHGDSQDLLRAVWSLGASDRIVRRADPPLVEATEDRRSNRDLAESPSPPPPSVQATSPAPAPTAVPAAIIPAKAEPAVAEVKGGGKIERLTGVWVEGPGFDITYGGSFDACAQRCLANAKCAMIEYYRPEKKCNQYDSARPHKTGGSSDVGIKR